MRARVLFASLFVLVALVTLASVTGAQAPQPQAAEGVQATLGTAFTYQGRLTDNGGPADGTYDFRFALFNASSGGSQVGSTLTLDNVQVDKGLFTVQLDFGHVFNGTALWLEVSVRPGNSSGNFTTLDPRQPLTATPYALYSTSAWNLSGNAGTTGGTNFLGTTDGQPLVLKTNNTEALRVDPAGNVGIGTAGPGGRFEVFAGSGAIAVMGTSTSRAVLGRLGIISCPGTFAVGGCAGDTGAAGVLGSSNTGIGVQGAADTGRAVAGYSTSGIGVIGDSTSRGVIGTLGRTSCAGTYAVGGCGADIGDGVVARSTNGVAVRAATTNGSIFVGEAPAGTNRARIDVNGKGFFNGGTQTGGADYAESMRTSENPAKLEPGDVLEIDPQHGYAVRRSSAPDSRLVAGVYSTQPSVLATGKHGIDDSLAGEVPVALLGVVPTKVSAENGPIEIGDLLVTSSLPGRAMKAQPQVVNGVAVYPTGAILGKALEPLGSGTGVIQVLVTLR